MVLLIAVRHLIRCARSDGDAMPTLFKEVQDEDGLDKAHAEESPKEVGSTPDIVLEHGSTRLSLDLDGWEWFWLFLTICFIGSLYANFVY